jgi:hypothetical protein
MAENNQGENLYNQYLEEAKNDENILGYVLGGGRGKGVSTEHSDYDVYVIVKDERLDEYKEKFGQRIVKKAIDFFVYSISEFKNYAAMGSGDEWNRYNFAYLKAQVDRAGIQEIIDEKGKMPEEKIKEVVESNLDSYINQYYRALKNNRDGNILAANLDGAESIPYFITALFAINGQIKPYNLLRGFPRGLPRGVY